jgi:hypothetical protein
MNKKTFEAKLAKSKSTTTTPFPVFPILGPMLASSPSGLSLTLTTLRTLCCWPGPVLVHSRNVSGSAVCLWPLDDSPD